ncbi:hypothetical protein BX616_001624 [Lobosporangium transversale]|nr:hypothetical protein BX616_001624 [Lobosporangium transversale]
MSSLSTADPNYRHPSPTVQTLYSDMKSRDNSLHPVPARTLFRNEVTQRAYSGQSSQMKRSFERLQRMDSGKVEYRTIAFCTHLTISRWEPPLPTSTDGSTEEGSSSATSSPEAARNNPAHAARLLTLANYISHILSLTAGIPNKQPHSAVAHQPKPEQAVAGNRINSTSSSNSVSVNVSSGPGPIKSESGRQHRYSPDYHHHLIRRNAHHQALQPMRGHSGLQQCPQDESVIYPYRNEPSYEQSYQEGPHVFDQRARSSARQDRHESMSRASSQFLSHQARRPNYEHEPQFQTGPPRDPPPLLRIPYPNLTLTLALIYVDRLKAKNKDAKGEAGCSHRLFLVAFIIAAKYRCSVELASPLTQDMDGFNQEHGSYGLEPSVDNRDNDNEYFVDGPLRPMSGVSTASTEQNLERSNAELIFSNDAWVRLLNLGSFYRQPIPARPTANSRNQGSYHHSHHTQSSGSPNSRASSEQSMLGQPSPSATSLRVRTPSDLATQAPFHAQTSFPSNSSIINATNASPTAAMLQVEDLDRMEAEFLTFLNYDLATMSHDLETCWNLLVGKKESRP